MIKLGISIYICFGVSSFVKEIPIQNSQIILIFEILTPYLAFIYRRQFYTI